MSTAWVLAALALLAAAVTVRRIRRAEAVSAAAWRRGHTAEQVMADAARWKADRRMRETREDRAICEAIWTTSQTHIPQPRKENGQ